MKMDNQKLLEMFYNISLIRATQERIALLYPEQEMRCPVHLYTGEEAIAAGVCANLRKEDIIFSHHRSHGPYISKGGSIKRLFAEIYGKATGSSKGVGGSQHLIDLPANFYGSTSIVGGTIPIAVGAAFGLKMQKKDNIVVSFFGDGAVEEGTFYESINFAALKKLPILFICENNFYAVLTPLSVRQPNRKISNLVNGCGIESYQEDGNDAIKVYNVTKKAIDKIKSGKGPVFIEFLTYRWKEHCGCYYDNDKDYRTEETYQKWKSHCPLEMLKKRLLSQNIITNSQINRMEEKINDKINKAVSFAKNSKFPDKSELTKHVYAD